MSKRVLPLLLYIFLVAVSSEDQLCGETNLNATAPPKDGWKVPKSSMAAKAVCKYNIDAEPTKLIQLTFKPSIISKTEKQCEKAVIEIDGFMDDLQTKIATICDTETGTPYFSSGSRMVVTINATNQVSPEALTADFEQVENFCGEQKLIIKSNEAQQWTKSGNDIQPGKICVYSIKARPMEVVKLTFKTIAGTKNPEQNTGSTPLIKLENYNAGKRNTIAEINPGEKDEMVYRSMEQEMIVTVYGTNGLTGELFTAEYQSIPDPQCGPAVFKASSDPSDEWKIPLETLTSDKICTYLIESDASKLVKLDIISFESLQQKKASECTEPYLELESVADSGNTKIADVCTGPFPKSFKSATSKMAVKLHGKNQMKPNVIKMVYQAASAGHFRLGIAIYMFTSFWMLFFF